MKSNKRTLSLSLSLSVCVNIMKNRRVIVEMLCISILIFCVGTNVFAVASQHEHTDDCFENISHVHSLDCKDLCGQITLYSDSLVNNYIKSCTYCGTSTSQVYARYRGTCSGCSTSFSYYYYRCKTCSQYTPNNVTNVEYIDGVPYHRNSSEYTCGYNEGDLHTPEFHVHNDMCSGGNVKSCTNGCAKHSHSGDSERGTGCYSGGNYTEGYVCGSMTNVSTSDGGTGGTCIVCDVGTYYITKYEGECDNCGIGIYGSVYTCDSCGHDMGYGYGAYGYGTHEYEGYYDLNCSKSTSIYYKGNSPCTVCGGDNKIPGDIICGLSEDKRYDCLGNEVSPVCDKCVTKLSPTSPNQKINALE